MSEQHSHMDAAIDATLAALRHVETPLDMEQRVMRALAQRAASDPLPTRRFPRLALPAAACACALALTAAVLLSYSARQHFQSSDTATSLRNPHPDPRNLRSAAPAEPPQVAREAEPPSPPPHRPARHLVTSVPSRAMRIRPSVPPVAPLTEQERLLQQIARSGDPGLRAMLNPDVLAQEQAANDAEFRDFFASTQNQNP